MENKKRLGKVGGQAVIEGVMMQTEDYKAIAVRKPNGEIEIKKDKIKIGIFGTHEIFHLFILAGTLCHFICVFFYIL